MEAIPLRARPDNMDTPLFKRPSEESVRRVSGDGSEDDVDEFLASMTNQSLPSRVSYHDIADT